MSRVMKFAACFLLAGFVVFLSCKKEHSCESCRMNNKPPIAIAGPDQLIILPTDSVLLDGRNSSDPDGSIISYHWTKISGPATFTITNASAARTVVKSLATGSYQFELKVTDDKGLSARDTMIVTVNDPTQPNRPPVANAGPDQTITLPTNNATLNGSGSTDPDNNITAYLWTKISGPSSFIIANPNTVQTQVTNLIEGIYQFELKVTDAGGLSAKDTTIVNVSNIPANCNEVPVQIINGNGSLIPFGAISPGGRCVGTAANKVVFAGGGCSVITNHVDIYDLSNASWSTATLSEARGNSKVAAVGSKILFAVGNYEMNSFSDRVDIYDANANTWSIATLSEKKYNGYVAVAVLGSKVFFAGGMKQTSDLSVGVSSRVDIYDASSNTWSIAELSQARDGIAAVANGNKVYFAGGYTAYCCDGDDYPVGPSSRIDIYDNTTNTWSTSELSDARFDISAMANGNKVLFAGGYYYGSAHLFPTSSRVDIYDASSNSWSISELSEPRSNIKAGKVPNKILFAGGVGNNNISGKVDIYDITTNSWSAAILSQPRIINEAASLGDKILLFTSNSQVNSMYMDVYDGQSNTLSPVELNYSLSSSAVIAAGNNIYIGGGIVGNSSGFHCTCMVWQFHF